MSQKDVNKPSLLYVHDHRFGLHNGRVYSRSAYPARHWDRYDTLFSSLKVIGRVSAVDEVVAQKLDPSEHPSVVFDLIGEQKRKRVCLGWLDTVGRIRRSVREFDAVVIRIPNRYAFVVATIAHSQQKPIGIEVSGCAWDAYWNHGSLLAKLYAPFAYLAMRRVAKLADAALYVTRRFLQRRYPTGKGTPSFSASNVEIASTISSDSARQLTRRIKDRSPIVFGTIGNYRTKYKGIHDAISACGKLKTTLADFEYRILGAGDTGPYKAIAETLGIAERVRFDGTLPPGERVLQWLDEIDIYLQPSYQEGLPRTLVEAMSRGKIAIGSTVGGIPELLSPEFLHPPGDVDELVHRIESTLDRDDHDWIIGRNIEKSREYLASRLQGARRSFLQSLIEKVDSI